MNFKILKSIICFFTVLIVFNAFTPFGVNASDEDISLQITDDVISYNLSVSGYDSLEEWVYEYLPNDIGICAEWYVLGLSQSGKYDFSEYEKALFEYLDNHKISSASTRLKFALSLASCGSDNEYIEATLNSSMGKQGIMSYVYGLHLLNNGFEHSEYSIESVIDFLLELQLSDGGWALRGDTSDVDVTAMTLQALAPYYSDEKTKKSVDSAINFLSEKQQDDGDYISYGISNPESGAQVITALSALNIDFISDSRFIKNENTLLDGILKYRLKDGSFSHTLNGESNNNSTVQVFYSMVSYQRFKEGKKGLYILDIVNQNMNDPEEFSESIEQIESKDEAESKDESSISKEVKNVTSAKIKINIIIIEICVFSFFVLMLVIQKKLNFKNFLGLFSAFLILIVLTLTVKIQSKEEYYNEQGISKENIIGNVKISRKCET